MAKKATIVQRMTDATNAVAEPGETPVASAYVVKGPNPYLVAILERTLVGVFGAYWLGWYRPYFVSLTDRRLLFFKLSLWTARSKGLDFAFPREAVELVSFNRGRMWGAIRVKNSDGKVIRLNGPRIRWGHEMDALADALQGAHVPAATEASAG